MKRKQTLLVRALVLATLLASGMALAQGGGAQSPAAPEALTTGFTYQGRLDQNGSPVNDTCDMRFKLYDAASMGAQVGGTINTAVPIVDGLFTVALDFGAGAFNGDRRWLGIEVDCEEDSTYDDLGRQELTAAPYALYAAGAPWSGLTGVPGGFADGVDDDTTYTAGEGLVLNGTEFGAQGSPYANVVVVAKSGGDYTSVQAAIDSITDATDDNPYLVWVAPGVYVEQVTMKPYVHLQGAGQEATVITSDASSSSLPPSQATLVLTRSTSLRDLTVGNGGMGSRKVALLATAGTTRTLVAGVTVRALGSGWSHNAIFLAGGDTGVILQHVTALAENAENHNSGLYSQDGAAVTLHGGSFTGRGGIYAYGIFNTGSGTRLGAEGVTALGENGSSNNCGLVNSNGAVATLRGGSFTARGMSYGYGIANSSGSTLEAEGITALGGNGSINNCGLVNSNGAVATLRGGSFTGRGGSYAWGIHNTGDGTRLEVTGVTGLGKDGGFNYGLYNRNGTEATLRGGSFTGRGGDDAYGIYNGDIGTRLEAEDVTGLGENGSSTNFGLYNDRSAETVLRGGSFTGRGGDDAYGIYNADSGTRLEVTSVTALGENGSDSNFGLGNRAGAAAVLRGGSFTARGGSQAWGIYNGESGTTLEATGVTALAENGSDYNYGLGNGSSATSEIDSSRFTGGTAGLRLISGTVRLSVTQLDGGASKASGTLTCFQVYDGSYASYTCPP